MKNVSALLILCFFSFTTYSKNNLHSQDDLTHFFEEADAFFKKYVDRSGGVNYVSINENSAEIKSLVSSIANIELDKAAKEYQISFYINAYNLLVINKLIINQIPNSPLDDKTFFSKEDVLVHRTKMSLDYLEKDILFGIERDPRFHFALVCGAKGCPPLKNMAYTPDNLELLLNDAALWSLNYPKFTRVDRVAKKIYLSQIFLWYVDDFTDEGKTLIDYANKYLSKSISPDFEIEFYDYDWSINSQ